ncbi:hypothetical protein R3P38DRAFT_2919614 [Favolaschia claudopus]|uniref:Uncharacterized protein n=1 Tax=Favolaschia claudopus TaxID=2862362 RepID=A0AAW0C109_9AGAR
MHLVLLALLCLAATKIGGIVWLRRDFVSKTYTFVGEDYPRVWPIKWPERQVLIPVHDTVRYQLETDDGAAEWSASLPGDGIIYLGECRPYTIGMFHQIRCLDILRKALVGVQSRNTSIQHDPENRDIARHCMGYLRQMVLCRSRSYIDPVLGYPQPNAHPDTDQCRDWTAVYQEAKWTHQRCGKT